MTSALLAICLGLSGSEPVSGPDDGDRHWSGQLAGAAVLHYFRHFGAAVEGDATWGTRRHRLVLGAASVAYHQPRYHTAWILYPRVGYRFISRAGVGVGALLGVGHARLFVGRDVYSVDGGQARLSRSRGYSTAATVAELELSYFFDRRLEAPVFVFLRPAFFGFVPVNRTLAPNVDFKIGAGYVF